MSEVGSSSKGGGLDTDLQQGQFEFGPSQFDMGAIDSAVGGNQQTTGARYSQLGMGGSTPELQDLAQQSKVGQATIGQEQTQDVGNPAFNPALQSVQTNLPSSAIIGQEQQSNQNAATIGKTAANVAGTAAAFA